MAHKYDRLFESDEESPPHEQILMSHDTNRWNQVQNLDDFFTRIYCYHRNSGFWCMFVNDLFQLLQFAFVVFFVVFLSCCVDYDKLGKDDPSISDAIDWNGITRIHGFVLLLVVIAMVYWVWRCFKFIYNTIKFLDIKVFYRDVLKIMEDSLSSLDWAEVQSKVIESQKTVQLCLHKDTLSELDISNRILRIENYKIAMINKNVLPYSFKFPVLGQRVFLSKGLMANMELILFSGPWAPFRSSWELDERYKRREIREELAQRLDKVICYMALVNFILLPFIFLWQLVFQIAHYAELVKREPGMLGVRIWSLYARHFLRHYNEMSHEFDGRLKKAYIPANKYLNLFTSPMLVIVSKNIGFFAGTSLLVLVILTLINEELLFADNVPLTITILGITVSVCKALIPDVNQVYCPDVLMKEVLQHTHYQPDSWYRAAHLPHVREQFSQLFVFKGVYLVEELISPLLTPFILFYHVRHKSLEFVDFLRNYTVNVVGVGDVCSFSQMDIKRHGNPEWMSFGMTSATHIDQAEHGKTELSLINFSIRNPTWKPKDNEAMYISTIKALAKQDGDCMAESQTGLLTSPMLASMGVPYFRPQPSLHSTSTITGQLSARQHQPSQVTLSMEQDTVSTAQDTVSTAQDTISLSQDVPQDADAILPPSEMHTNIAQKKYIFDDQYNKMERSYRDTRQPITMPESITEPSVQAGPSGVGHVTQLEHFPSLMNLSTLDASGQLFMSASPDILEHSNYAMRSSLSQDATEDGTMNVFWTGVRREYREMAKSEDLNSSSLYLHSLHSRLKQKSESAEDMMTRSLHARMAQSYSPQSYPPKNPDI